MISSFNLVKLDSLLKDFYNITKLRITIFDESFNEITSYPKQLATTCQIIRKDASAHKKCNECDAHACEIAAMRHSAFIYQCHAGLTESIAPIYLGNIVIGYLLFGHVFSYDSYEDGWEKIKYFCKDYQIDMISLKKACLNQPIISHSYITSSSHILHAVASYLCMERLVSLHHHELPVKIDEYITANFTKNINIPDICQKFHVGKTQLYKISKQSYGIGIAKHIRNLRISKAKELLKNTDYSITEISTLCGFADYNYFISVFKRVEGITPNKFKKQSSNKINDCS